MRLAIMQPYFCPYIGYFQLINAVDEFIIYDNIQFTKKGWINRNRILVNGKDAFITLPLKKDSDYLVIKDRWLADSWSFDSNNMLNRIRESYRKAAHFPTVFPLMEQIIMHDNRNLFDFILNSVYRLTDFLGIRTPITISSAISIDHSLKGEEKVLALCKAKNASVYVNPIGGLELYQKEMFSQNELELSFIKCNSINYSQFGLEFIPWLSIIDVLMFNSREKISLMLADYKEI